jgi:RNA polymerase sporulation-specific sigma factor
LVAHIVKKYNSTGHDCDDLISIGTIGLIKAISTFDQHKGTRLATYAVRCIENAIYSMRKHTVILMDLERFNFPGCMGEQCSEA